MVAAFVVQSNYIDAQAMMRRSTYDRHGGYRRDDFAYGWEDYRSSDTLASH
jgi:hypothetical protein